MAETVNLARFMVSAIVSQTQQKIVHVLHMHIIIGIYSHL